MKEIFCEIDVEKSRLPESYGGPYRILPMALENLQKITETFMINFLASM